MKHSTIQLEEFNDCPGTVAARRHLEKYQLNTVVEVVDISDIRTSYYQNDGATLVLALPRGPQHARLGLALGRMATELAADEFTWFNLDGRLVVRLWWD